MQPKETNTPEQSTKKQSRQRHYLAAFFLSFMWGAFGVDRFYLGKVGTGLLKLITFGGFGLWTIIDFILIANGAMKDRQGREMLQVAEYKKFAGKTVLIFAITLGLVILANGLLVIWGLTELMTMVQSGEFLKQIPGLENIPIEQLQQLQNGDFDPSKLEDLNL